MNLLKVALLSDQDININIFNSRALLSFLTTRAQGARRGRQPVSQDEGRSHLRQTNANLTLWLRDGGWALSGGIIGYYCQSSPQSQFLEV